LGKTKKTSIKLIVRIMFHASGIGFIASSILLQFFILINIMQKGYFLANEENLIILWSEIFFTIFAFIYFLFLLWKILPPLFQKRQLRACTFGVKCEVINNLLSDPRWSSRLERAETSEECQRVIMEFAKAKGYRVKTVRLDDDNAKIL